MLGVIPTQRMSPCVCSKREANTQIPCEKNNHRKTLRRCLQGSLRQEFTGQLRANLPPSGARRGSRPPYSSVSFCSQTACSKSTVYAVLLNTHTHERTPTQDLYQSSLGVHGQLGDTPLIASGWRETESQALDATRA